MGPCRSCWNGTTSALQPEEITLKGTRVFMCVLSIKEPIRKRPETYLMFLLIGKSYYRYVLGNI